MNPNETIIMLAKSYGFDGAKFLFKWRGCNVFEPTTNDPDNPPIIGYPLFILQYDNIVREAMEDEWHEILGLIEE